MTIHKIKYTALFLALFFMGSCSKDFLELDPIGSVLESSYYQNEEEIFEALVATYDVLSWGGTSGWTMKLGLLNSASDDCFAGGSDASDQPSWVAWDNFTLDPFLGPQLGLWQKGYTGIYRANLTMEKANDLEGLDEAFRNRTIAEAKFLRAFYYFDLVRLFGNVPLIDQVVPADQIYQLTQSDKSAIYALIESDLNDARNTFELPETLAPDELGRITKGAATALLGKVILYQNDEGRMAEAAQVFEEVINSGIYGLEANFEDIFLNNNEFGIESVFEINYSGVARAGWGQFANGSEGNYDVQFFGMRDYVGPLYATGWSFCPVTEKLAEAMAFDPRFEHTIIDGDALKNQGASYTEGFQNTDFFIKKYAPLEEDRALDGEPALNWGNNVREIRFADVLLMAAEAHARSGNAPAATGYLNQVRQRVSLQPFPTASGQELLDRIHRERQFELACEGHRFFDLVRTGKASAELEDQGFMIGKSELLPIPQSEIDITEGNLIQNPGY